MLCYGVVEKSGGNWLVCSATCSPKDIVHKHFIDLECNVSGSAIPIELASCFTLENNRDARPRPPCCHTPPPVPPLVLLEPLSVED